VLVSHVASGLFEVSADLSTPLQLADELFGTVGAGPEALIEATKHTTRKKRSSSPPTTR
jgi:hypothetical protein